MNKANKYPIRILQVFASLDRGGAETMIMNIYRKIDKSKIQFDFVVNEDKPEYDYEKEINSLGGKIFRLPRFKPGKYNAYRNKFEELLIAHPEYKIIHGHHTTPSSVYIKVAHKFGRKVIAHSHTSGEKKINLKDIIRKHLIRNIQNDADYLFSCGIEASKWMFKEKYKEALIINNAIDLEKFYFNSTLRNQIRKKYGIKDEFVLGHIGRFEEVKNHKFIIKVFNEILKLNQNSKLILIGEGTLKNNIINIVNENQINDKVIFTGSVNNVNEYVNSFDSFIFPSLYEGLPVTLVEVQANGLKIYASSDVPKESDITGNIHFIDLKNGAKYWAEKILNDTTDRNDVTQIIKKSGYDVEETTKAISVFYLEKYNELIS